MPILDYDQLLVADGGQIFNGGSGVAKYGTLPYDMQKVAFGNPGKGKPLHVFMRVLTASVNNATNGLLFDLVADDDGAGGNEVSLLSGTKTIALANLTVAKGIRRIGTIDPSAVIGAANRYVVPKVTTVAGGTAPTTGNIEIWLSEGNEAGEANEANNY